MAVGPGDHTAESNLRERVKVMKKRTEMQVTDPVVSRKVPVFDQHDRGGSSVFTSGVKALTVITAAAVAASVFVPVVLGIDI